MQFSENTTDISKALSAVQAELKNPYNSADNPFYKSKYAPLPDILNMIRPVLGKNGLSIIQTPRTSENQIGVETTILHQSGQLITLEPFYLKPAKNDPQTAGGAITYARRYQLCAILGICGDDDDDGNDASGKKADAKQSEYTEKGKQAQSQMKKRADLVKQVKELVSDIPAMLKHYNVGSIDDLSVDQLEYIIKRKSK